MSEQNKKEWYVIRAISGKEKKVKEYLDAEISHNETLRDFVSQVLIPIEKVYSVRNGKKITKEKNCYPGYVLIETELSPEVMLLVKETPNVLGFLNTGGKEQKPIPIRQSEISRILGRVDEMTENGEDSEVEFIVGETVVVNDGPFSSFSGIIEEVNDEKKKLKVMVKIFGRKTPLELSFFQVKRES